MKYTKETLAALLNGREYRDEISSAEENDAKASGLVVVFGASDDLMELRGAISDEAGCNDGGDLTVDSKGLIPDWEVIDHDDEREVRDYLKRKDAVGTRIISALWCKEGGYSWTYETEIQHATFEVVEDGKPYCRGIVFDLKDL